MRIAVVGATGLVGRVMLEELFSGDFELEVDDVVALCSPRSEPGVLEVCGRRLSAVPVDVGDIPEVDIALFSAGSFAAKELAPLFVEKGAVVIDNSSAFRMDPCVPLVVPEVNADAVGEAKLVANPNCSTIQLVVVLAPLMRFGVEEVWVASYQAISGAGRDALVQFLEEWEDLWDWLEGRELSGLVGRHPYADVPAPLFSNVVPAIGRADEDGFFTEELKLRNETKKILGAPHLAVYATAVRVPVVNGHSEAVSIRFSSEVDLGELISALGEAPGVVVVDGFPTPVQVSGRREVYVGRVRRDPQNGAVVHLWIVADNLRKGAATNAVQIAELVAKRFG